MSDATTATTGPTALGHRFGPFVALVGVLGALAVTAWVALAPDNVVGPVTDAPFSLGATAVLEGEANGCVTLVQGDGQRRELCIRGLDDPDPDVWFDDRGRLVVQPLGGDPAVVDLATGATAPSQDEPPGQRVAADVHTDRGVVRAGPCCDDDGEVLLDLGGPAGNLRSATVAPEQRVVVARDGRDRVLVADPARPDEVHEWFVLTDDDWLDLDRVVGWTG